MVHEQDQSAYPYSKPHAPQSITSSLNNPVVAIKVITLITRVLQFAPHQFNTQTLLFFQQYANSIISLHNPSNHLPHNPTASSHTSNTHNKRHKAKTTPRRHFFSFPINYSHHHLDHLKQIATSSAEILTIKLNILTQWHPILDGAWCIIATTQRTPKILKQIITLPFFKSSIAYLDTLMSAQRSFISDIERASHSSIASSSYYSTALTSPPSLKNSLSQPDDHTITNTTTTEDLSHDPVESTLSVVDSSDSVLIIGTLIDCLLDEIVSVRRIVCYSLRCLAQSSLETGRSGYVLDDYFRSSEYSTSGFFLDDLDRAAQSKIDLASALIQSRASFVHIVNISNDLARDLDRLDKKRASLSLPDWNNSINAVLKPIPPQCQSVFAGLEIVASLAFYKMPWSDETSQQGSVSAGGWLKKLFLVAMHGNNNNSNNSNNSNSSSCSSVVSDLFSSRDIFSYWDGGVDDDVEEAVEAFRDRGEKFLACIEGFRGLLEVSTVAPVRCILEKQFMKIVKAGFSSRSDKVKFASDGDSTSNDDDDDYGDDDDDEKSNHALINNNNNNNDNSVWSNNVGNYHRRSSRRSLRSIESCCYLSSEDDEKLTPYHFETTTQSTKYGTNKQRSEYYINTKHQQTSSNSMHIIDYDNNNNKSMQINNNNNNDSIMQNNNNNNNKNNNNSIMHQKNKKIMNNNNNIMHNNNNKNKNNNIMHDKNKNNNNIMHDKNKNNNNIMHDKNDNSDNIMHDKNDNSDNIMHDKNDNNNIMHDKNKRKNNNRNNIFMSNDDPISNGVAVMKDKGTAATSETPPHLASASNEQQNDPLFMHDPFENISFPTHQHYTSSSSSTSNSSWELPLELQVQPKDIALSRKSIGSGGTSKVFRGQWRGTQVAVKILTRLVHVDKADDRGKKEFLRELAIMTRLRHPNLVLLMGAATASPPYALVTEFCHGGSLFHLLHVDGKKRKLTMKQKLKILVDVARGMSFLHTCVPPLVHRDLKSLNILLSENILSDKQIPVAKLADFGLSRFLPDKASGSNKEVLRGSDNGGMMLDTAAAGTYQWMAPEVLCGSMHDEACDIYSFAIVVHETLSESLPYSGVYNCGDNRGLGARKLTEDLVLKGQRPPLSILPKGTPVGGG